MFEHVARTVSAIEADPAVNTRAEAYSRLRAIGLEAFGTVLWSMPNPAYPKLSGLLPRMASADVQRKWTGNVGAPLLMQTAPFVRSMGFNFTQITGRRLQDARALDYGCGYGRMMRLLYCYLEEHQVVGVDPWSESVRICSEDGLNNVQQSDYLPQRLPATGKFDLMFAFSVFTHTSKRATIQALKTLREYVTPNGVLAITIRPQEYWSTNRPELAPEKVADHEREGFAFLPQARPPVDGDVTYGETSMSTHWLAVNCPMWKLAAEDGTSQNALQRYLFLLPA